MASRDFQAKLGLAVHEEAKINDNVAQIATIAASENVVTIEGHEPVAAFPTSVTTPQTAVIVPFPLPIDPRPDLINDSRLWDALFKAQYAMDGEESNGLFQLLHGLRCCGAQIKSSPKFRYVLDQGEIGDTEWNGEQSTSLTQPNNGFRGLLLPYRARLTILLRNLP